jgi:S-adenosylmethionine-diacylgycerolhomoserine-N-methlytransferase
VLRKKGLHGKDLISHGWFRRTFWRVWFDFDNVNLNPDHLPYLLSHFTGIDMKEQTTSIPYIPLLRCPYYMFIGEKKKKD